MPACSRIAYVGFKQFYLVHVLSIVVDEGMALRAVDFPFGKHFGYEFRHSLTGMRPGKFAAVKQKLDTDPVLSDALGCETENGTVILPE